MLLLTRIGIVISLLQVWFASSGFCKEWWQTTSVYQIYPRSFKDSDGDGVGDINGITSKLEHFVDMGVKTIWLTPFYKSPMVDGGYDISDFLAVNPIYGNVQDFDKMVRRAHALGLKVVVDFVPNHTSDQHEWFKKALQGIQPYRDYYVWNEGKIDENGKRQPPNNWLSVFNSGSAWEWVEQRKAYYLHQFSVVQPDLNFSNPRVRQEMKDTLTFWLERGVDGFRIDSALFMIEDPSLKDEPLSGSSKHPYPDWYYLDHIYVVGNEKNYEIVKEWREHIDNYSNNVKKDKKRRILMTEAYHNVSMVTKFYNYSVDIPFNFFFIKDKDGINAVIKTTAREVKQTIDLWMNHMPKGATANWVMGNHDNSRLATRYGSDMIDGLNFLTYLLPGITIIYNGDEIGMTNTEISWEDTEDPQACSTDPEHYMIYSRDPVRTPYQWDNTTSAGFSKNSTTFLPVNKNYLTVNLKSEKLAAKSYYRNVQKLMKLRNKNKAIENGDLTSKVIRNSVIAYTRTLPGQRTIVVVVNWTKKNLKGISLNSFKDLKNPLTVLLTDVNSNIKLGTKIQKNNFSLPPHGAVVLSE